MEKLTVKYFSLISILILLFLLTIFGKVFTKLVVIYPLHLYDLLLGVIAVISLLQIPKKIYFPKIVITILISIIYLILSIDKFVQFDILIRQYSLFIYLIISYIIFTFLIDHKNISWILKKIFLLIKIGFILQVIYSIIILIFGKNNDFIYDYFSPLIVMLCISFFSYNFIFLKKKYNYLLLFFVSIAIGHQSFFLSLIVMILFVFFQKRKFNIFKLFIIIIPLSLILINNIEGFTDVNAIWRLVYWYGIFENLIFENYFIFGNGFGVPYASNEIIILIEGIMNNTSNLDLGDEMYLSAPHNSFITILFHIGILPGFIFLKSIFNKISFSNYENSSKNLKFLIITLIGCSVWVSFNVILELPHSSLYYWLIVFLLLKLNLFENQRRIFSN